MFLDYAKITDKGLKHLRGLTKLESLGLQDTLVTDAGLEYLSSLTRLASLDFSGSRVTGEGVEELKKVLRWMQDYQLRDVGSDGYKEGPEAFCPSGRFC